MRRAEWLLLSWLAATSSAWAQGAANVTLQLPSFSNVGVDTTVLVPDRGGTALGGNTQGRAGSGSWNGLGRGRALGVERQATSARVSALIHDQRAAERALAAVVADRSRQPTSTADPQRPLARAAVDASLPSVAELRTRQIDRWAAQQQAAYATFERGKRAEQAGKHSVAAIYYRAAARQASGTLRQVIDQQLRSLAEAQTPSTSPATATH